MHKWLSSDSIHTIGKRPKSAWHIHTNTATHTRTHTQYANKKLCFILKQVEKFDIRWYLAQNYVMNQLMNTNEYCQSFTLNYNHNRTSIFIKLCMYSYLSLCVYLIQSWCQLLTASHKNVIFSALFEIRKRMMKKMRKKNKYKKCYKIIPFVRFSWENYAFARLYNYWLDFLCICCGYSQAQDNVLHIN